MSSTTSMSMTTTEKQCSICEIANDTFMCTECSQVFCFTHTTEHREKIKKTFLLTEKNFDTFKKFLIQSRADSIKHPLIQKINQWEYESIEQIKEIASECRQRVVNYNNKYLSKVEIKLNYLLEQIKTIRTTSIINETDLEQLKYKLDILKDEVDETSNLSVKEETTNEFINKIAFIVPTDKDDRWKQDAVTIAGGSNRGHHLNELHCPWGVRIDDDQTIYIADQGNNRIIEWKSNALVGRVVAGGNEHGDQLNQLKWPVDVLIDRKTNSLIISDQDNRRVMEWSRELNTESGEILIPDIDCHGLAMDKNGDLYVSDFQKHEVRRWKRGEPEGILVAGGNGQGNKLNQFNYPSYIFVDDQLSVYVSDENNHRVMKWTKDSKEGIVVAGGQGQGNTLRQLSCPCGIIADQFGQVFVSDHANHRVMRWYEGDEEGNIVVGGNGQGKQMNQLNSPTGLAMDRDGNIYVVDHGNHRVEKFEII